MMSFLRKNPIYFLLIIIALMVVAFMIIVRIYPSNIDIYSSLTSIVFSGITIIILLVTMEIYRDILLVSARTLKVSDDTLSFTKTQTSYNSYFDNYKLFFELSKIKTDKLVEGKLNDDLKQYFDDLTFNTIHYNYLKILELVPSPKLQTLRYWYDLMFLRFNYKIQSFIDILTDEIVKIKDDSNLSFSQKVSLINLYKNFIMNDYINLCRDLIKNRNYYKDNPSESIFSTNLLKCNEKGIIFDLDRFLRLYNEMEKPFEDVTN